MDVSPVFTGAELVRLGDIADSALEAARQTAPQGQITQTLAAGVELVDRYEAAHDIPACYARALVTAAMDACRLGWNAPLPDIFLREAAPGYLTERQRAEADPDRWFTAALLEARKPVHGVTAALELVSKSDAMGAQLGVSQLTDYLNAYGTTSRKACSPPSTFWTAVASHATNPDHLTNLGVAAARLDLPQVAQRMVRLAVDVGNKSAYSHLALVHEEAGDPVEAERVAQIAADIGLPRTYLHLVMYREEEGDPVGAERAAQLATDAGVNHAYLHLMLAREEAGDAVGAERAAQLATDAGVPDAYMHLMVTREHAGDPAGAEQAAQLATKAGVPDAYLRLMVTREHAGDPAGAEQAAQLATKAGDNSAQRLLEIMRVEAARE
ncbi:hypothetical protein [Streptomyces luteogriseus]|uniref:hypothetical protein n=1 Tax=Streptomyces luteogriseus TaxID=68233 RepID=UPI0037A5B6BC